MARSAEQLYVQGLLDGEELGWVDATPDSGDHAPSEIVFRQGTESVVLYLRFNGGDPAYFGRWPERFGSLLTGMRPAHGR